MAQQKGMVHVTGAKDLVEALSHLSTRTGSILATAIRDALRPVVGPMRQQVLRVVKNDNKSSKHWSVSETDYKTRVKKNGKRVFVDDDAAFIGKNIPVAVATNLVNVSLRLSGMDGGVKEKN